MTLKFCVRCMDLVKPRTMMDKLGRAKQCPKCGMIMGNKRYY